MGLSRAGAAETEIMLDEAWKCMGWGCSHQCLLTDGFEGKDGMRDGARVSSLGEGLCH